jgi:hypothetical protein
MTTTLSSGAILVALLSVSCLPSPDYKMMEKEAELRYIAETDELYLMEVQRDLRINPEKADVLKELAGGHRRYPPEGGILSIDIDADLSKERARIAERREEGEERVEDRLALRTFDLFEDVEVLEAGLFHEEGTLSLYRLSRTKNATAWVDLINDWVNAGLIEESDKYREIHGEFSEGAHPWSEAADAGFSLETATLWEDRARSDEPWVKLSDQGIHISFPIKGSEVAGTIRYLAEKERYFDAYQMQLLRNLSDMRVSDGELELWLRPGVDGFYRVPTEPPGEYRPKLGAGTEEHAQVVKQLKESVGFVEFDRRALLSRFGLASAESEPR